MNCAEAEKLLHAYHDGELSGEDKEKVERHLAKCPGCQEKLAEIKALDQLLVDGKAEEVPDPGTHYWHSFPHRIKSEIMTRRETSVRPRRKYRWRFKLLPYLSAGVAILLAIVIAVPFLKPEPKGLSEEEVADITSPPEKTDIGFEKVKKDEGEEALVERQIAVKKEPSKAEPVGEEPRVTVLPSESSRIPSKEGEAEVLAEAPSEKEAGGVRTTAKKAEDEELNMEAYVPTGVPAGVPTGTLKVVIDSAGNLKKVSVQTSSGDVEADSAALRAYRDEWEDKTFRHRERTLLVPFRAESAE